ncbi:PTS transporter subunit EIIC [Streptomyces sp. M10(2022)]
METEAEKEHYAVAPVLGIESIDTGLLGAVAVGVIVAVLHNRYRTKQMPDALAFFGGLRFVPIVSALVMSFLGLLVPLVWPTLNGAIADLGEGISHTGVFGPFFFGLGECCSGRSACTTYSSRSSASPTRAAPVRSAANTSAVRSISSTLSCPARSRRKPRTPPRSSCRRARWPYIWGLPGAALAMYHCAKREMRPEIKALLISGVVACVVGGITEPLEFLFLFIAPWLYLLHAVLVGLGFLVAAVLGVYVGNTDGNVIDLLVFGVLQGTSTKWYLIPVIAAVWFAVYYFVFRFAITRFNLMTPGRASRTRRTRRVPRPQTHRRGERFGRNSGRCGAGRHPGRGKYDPAAILEALGGADNIRTLDNCITRLRMSVEDAGRLDEPRLKKLGAVGVVTLDKHTVQVIIGPQVQSVKDAIAELAPIG